jgi:hypothetical protein
MDRWHPHPRSASARATTIALLSPMPFCAGLSNSTVLVLARFASRSNNTLSIV